MIETPKCQVCNWVNTGLLNLGDSKDSPEESTTFWICPGCIKRERESLLAKDAERKAEVERLKAVVEGNIRTARAAMNNARDHEATICKLESELTEARAQVAELTVQVERLTKELNQETNTRRDLHTAWEVATAQVEKVKEDGAMLDWLISRSAYVSHSRDGDCCNVWYRYDDDGQDGGPVEGYPQKCYNEGRTAITAAMEASK